MPVIEFIAYVLAACLFTLRAFKHLTDLIENNIKEQNK
jgi:hypothetical protein